MAKTEAAVAGEDHLVRLQEVELPELTATRVKVRTWYSGISCGTEGDGVTGRATYMTRPLLMGYQSVGEVVEAGANVRTLRKGDLVFTRGGELWNMKNMFGGSHARELVVEETAAFGLSRNHPSLPTASYAALAAVAVEGVRRLAPRPGGVLVVYGLGMLGQLAGKAAQLLGLRVVGVNRAAWKRDAAKEFGFDAVCAPDAEEIAATVKRLGFGPAEYAVDLTGNQQIFDLALGQLAFRGQLALLGYYPDHFRVNFDLCHARQLAIHSPVGWGEQIPQVLAWMEEKRLNIDPLIRQTVAPAGLTEFYRSLVEQHTDHLGVVIDWRK